MTKVNGNTAVYNAENQLASLSTTTGASEVIAYDALGHRVQKTVSGSSPVTYVYDAFRLAAEYVNGSWVKDYIADGKGKLIGTENAAGGPCTTCYYTSDHLGSVRAVTDSNANVVARHDYLPFGEEIQANTAGRDQNFGSITDVTERFTGQIRDQESGVDYFNARYYTAPLGRFNSPDPGNAGASLLSSQSWNGYGYVLGNPLNSVDPSGMLSGSPCEGNTACEGQIPGCLQNLSACAAQQFAPDIIQGGLLADPFQIQRIPIVVADYGFHPYLTFATLDGAWNKNGVATGFSIVYGGVGWGFAQVGTGFNLDLIPVDHDSFGAAVVNQLARSAQAEQQMVFAAAGGSVVAGITLVPAAGVAASGSVPSLFAGETPVIGALADTGTKAGLAGYNVLTVANYDAGVQATWMAETMASGQSYLTVTPLSAAAPGSIYAAEEVPMLLNQGYSRIGGFLVPKVPGLFW